MGFEEMIVALGALGLVGYGSMKIFDLIKSWINRNSNSIPEESFNRLAKAFMEHKENTERRLQNLEAIASEEGSENRSSSENQANQIEAPREPIEIEDQESAERESQSGDDSNLRNMLRE